MARADPVTGERQSLYERDYCQWVEQQVRLLREGRLRELDMPANLIDEIEDWGINRKHAVTSNLVVVLNHLSQAPVPAAPAVGRSWLASIAEHRRRLRKEFQHAPSLRGYAREEFEESRRTRGRSPGSGHRRRAGDGIEVVRVVHGARDTSTSSLRRIRRLEGSTGRAAG